MSPALIKSLSDNDLIKSTERVVEQERKIVQVVIWHLQEIQDRKLFISMGYDSLYKCLIKHFKMSDTTAYGRIKVLKILEDVPEVSDSLKLGELNISNIALAHSFIEKHQKTTGEILTVENKIDLMSSLKDKTTAETKLFLARCNPEMELPFDEIKPLNGTHSQIKSTVKNELIERINYLKSLISHKQVNPTHEELLILAFDALIEKTEKKMGIQQVMPKEPKHKNEKTAATSKSATQSLTDRKSRYIPRKVKRIILKRSNHQCEDVNDNGERCDSKFQTQFDHIIAFSKGGDSSLENLQLLCRTHNAFKGDK